MLCYRQQFNLRHEGIKSTMGWSLHCCEWSVMEVLTKARRLSNKWHFKPLSLPQPHIFCMKDIFHRLLVFQMLLLTVETMGLH